jgi:RNA polymerase sigma-70 factor (ECF subfamily)
VHDTTAALIARARAPDEPLATRQAAFSVLVERFQDGAYGYAYTLLGDSQLARDATQEAFIAAYGSLSQLRAPDAFSGWLRRIVRTYCSRLCRGELDVAPLESLAGRVAGNSDPAVAAEVRERRATIAAALRTLPDRERLVILLFYVGGYPQLEIAEQLGVPLTTVKKRLQAARQRLRATMGSLMDDEPGEVNASAAHGEAGEVNASAAHGEAGEVNASAARFRRAMRLLAAFDLADDGRQLAELLLIDGIDVNASDVQGKTRLSRIATLLRRAARPG